MLANLIFVQYYDWSEFILEPIKSKIIVLVLEQNQESYLWKYA